MLQKIKIAALSAVLGLGTLAALPATAQADSFYFGISPQGPRAGVIVDDHRSFRGPRDRRDRWDRWNRGCSPREALNKASRMGIRGAHIRSENRNVIRVGGRSRGHRVTVVFANAPRCPIIR